MKTVQELTCIVCPNSCRLTAEMEGSSVNISGYKCSRGLDYGRQEALDPRRYLTASVLADNLDLTVVPVKSKKPLPKDKLLPAMEQVKKFRLNKAVKIGAVLIPDLAGTGIALVATRNTKFIC